MNARQTARESLDRLILLTASRPREGWEDIYEEIARREDERIAPYKSASEGNEKGPAPAKDKAHDPQGGSTVGSIPE
jgi:hypothetical protein